MLSIDMRNAVDGNNANNFHYMLFRLLFKADKYNFELLKEVYPIEARMVHLYKHNGPFKNFDVIEEQAKEWYEGDTEGMA